MIEMHVQNGTESQPLFLVRLLCFANITQCLNPKQELKVSSHFPPRGFVHIVLATDVIRIMGPVKQVNILLY